MPKTRKQHIIEGARTLANRQAVHEWNKKAGGRKSKPALQGRLKNKHALLKNIALLSAATHKKARLLADIAELQSKHDQADAEEAELVGTVEALVNTAMASPATRHIHRTIRVAMKL